MRPSRSRRQRTCIVPNAAGKPLTLTAPPEVKVAVTPVTAWLEEKIVTPLLLLPPQPNCVAARAIARIAPNTIRRRRGAGIAVSIRPSNSNPATIGNSALPVSVDAAPIVMPAYLIPVSSLTGWAATTALSEKVSEAPPASPIGARPKCVVALAD